ncbi:TPA: hypothetical protein P0E15_005115 [Vibrio harveyi]|nr:hypothetical protein [Vibrio harveyi]
MGYRVSSLVKTPKVPGIELYIFIVGDVRWKSGFAKELMDNFDSLAHKLGEKGAIVAPHDGNDLTEDFSEYFSSLAYKNQDISELLASSKGIGLLLISAHPEDLTEDDTVVYSPVEQLHGHFGSLEYFFNELCEFSKTGDPTFVEKFQEAKGGKVQEAVEILDINPNIFGFGFNLNPLKRRALGAVKAGYNKAFKSDS